MSEVITSVALDFPGTLGPTMQPVHNSNLLITGPQNHAAAYRTSQMCFHPGDTPSRPRTLIVYLNQQLLYLAVLANGCKIGLCTEQRKTLRALLFTWHSPDFVFSATSDMLSSCAP